MRRRGTFRDPTFARARTSALAALLDTLPPVEAQVVRYRLALGLPVREIAARMELPPHVVNTRLYQGLSKLRHPARAFDVYDELHGDGVTQASAELRAWLTMTPIKPKRCAHCGLENVDPIGADGAGRPRQYCANACRQAAYRARRKLRAISPTQVDV